MDRVYTIRTPEMVRFEYRLAGPASRMFAWGIDMLALAAMLTALMLVGCLGNLVLSLAKVSDVGWSLMLFAAFALYYGYFAFAEWRTSGRTIGKKIMGLRVLQSGGMRILAFHALARNVLRVLDSVFPFYTVGSVALLSTLRMQRLGDLVAGTIVVHDDRPPQLPKVAAQGDDPVRSAILSDKGLPRRMARRLRNDERELLFDAARRADEIDLEVRGPLFARLAEHFSARLGLARDPHVSDERLVQNLARALLSGERDGSAGGL